MRGQSITGAPSYMLVEKAPAVVAPSSLGETVETAVLWRILWGQRRAILLTALIATVLALAYSLLTPSLYSTTSQVIIDPRDRVIVANDITPSSLSPDGGVTQVESQVSVMQSNSVLLRAIAATDLVKDTEFNGQGVFDRIIDMFSFDGGDSSPDAAISSTQSKTLANLRKRLAVKRADKVLVIDVTVTARSADKAARLANAIADAYLEDQSAARSAAARQASQALRARLTEQRKRVEEAETAAEKFRAANNLITSTGQLVSDQQLNELNNQLSAAQARTVALKAQIDQQRQGGLSDSTAEVQRSAVITKLREQEAALVESLANLSTQLGPLHPSLVASQARLRNLRNLITAELQRVTRSSQGEYERAVANEKAIAAKFEQLKSRSVVNDTASIRLRELQREVEAVRSVYANFLVRAQETSEQANVNTTNARIITRAIKPQKKSWPPTPLLVLGAALSGLAIGASGVLVREFMKPMVRSPAQISAITGAPVLATVQGPTKVGKGSEASQSILNTVDPISRRAIQVLLTERGNTRAHDRGNYAGRSIAIASAAEDIAERMHVVRMIAATAGMNGDETLLVDADLGDDKQTSTPGLMDFLRGDCGISEALQQAPDGDYMLMESGSRRTKFRSVSPRDFDKQAFSNLRRHVDLMVVDVGAIGENHLAAPFAVGADEVLFVAHEAKTSHREVVAAVQVAQLIGAPITGVVFVRGA